MSLQGAVPAFSRASFIAAVTASLRPSLRSLLRSVDVHWVCPGTACPSNVCPATSQLREQVGCQPGSAFPRRHAAALQGSAPYFVDYGFNWNTPQAALARQQALEDVNTELGRCWQGQRCVFEPFQPATNVPVVPTTPVASVTTAPSADDDDDNTLPWWGVLLIVLAGVLVCCLVIAAVWLTRRKRHKQVPGIRDYAADTTIAPDSKYEPSMPPVYGSDYYGRDPGGDMQQWDPAQKPHSYSSPATDSVGALHSGYDDGSYTYSGMSGSPSRSGTEWSGAAYQHNDPITAQYIDGVWYEGIIWSANEPDAMNPEGTYNIRWYDGSHSEWVPPEQIRPN